MAEQRFKYVGLNGEIEYELIETDGMEVEIHAENMRAFQVHKDHPDVWVEGDDGIWELIPPLAFPEDEE